MTEGKALKKLIADAEREVEELESRLVEARGSLAWLRRRAKDAHANTADVRRRLESIVRDVEPVAEANISRTVRGETTSIILSGVREFPGRTGVELASLLAPRLGGSAAQNPRKLVFSVLGYLRDRKHLVTRDGAGRYFPKAED